MATVEKISKTGAVLRLSGLPELKFYEEILPQQKIFKVFKNKDCCEIYFCHCIKETWNDVLREHLKKSNNHWQLKKVIFENGDSVQYGENFTSWNCGINTRNIISTILFIRIPKKNKKEITGWNTLTPLTDNEKTLSYFFDVERIREVIFESKNKSLK